MSSLVLVPGMVCDARLFAPQIAALSARHFIACAPITEWSSVGELAADILARAPPRFALAGLSMGGIVAMEMLRLAPGRVERIALLDTNPLAESDVVKSRRLPQMKAVREGRLAEVMRNEMKPNYLAKGPHHADVLSLCMDMALSLGPTVFLNQSRALMDRLDQTRTLQAAALPALILCGRHDTLCPIDRHELMAELIPGAQLKIIENAGHLPTLEQPAETNAALTYWLDS